MDDIESPRSRFASIGTFFQKHMIKTSAKIQNVRLWITSFSMTKHVRHSTKFRKFEVLFVDETSIPTLIHFDAIFSDDIDIIARSVANAEDIFRSTTETRKYQDIFSFYEYSMKYWRLKTREGCSLQIWRENDSFSTTGILSAISAMTWHSRWKVLWELEKHHERVISDCNGNRRWLSSMHM